MASKWRLVTDPEDAMQLARAGLLYWNCGADSGRGYNIANPVWEKRDMAELGIRVKHLFVLVEGDDDDGQ